MLKTIQLSMSRSIHLLVQMADADCHDATEKVQVLPPFDVPDILVLRGLDDEGLVKVMEDGRKRNCLPAE